MSRRIFNRIAVVSALALFSVFAYAEDDTGAFTGYSPYSIFGIGEIHMQGTAYNRSMGGVGIALRDNRFINIINPAAVSARDTLTFMADFGIGGNNKYLRQNLNSSLKKSTGNTFNMVNCVISFPIYKSLSMAVGVVPYSSTGYEYISYETDQKTIADVGNVTYSNAGNGGLYQGFATLGFTLWDKLSLGAQGMIYFGNILKTNYVTYSNEANVGINDATRMTASTFSGKFGFQFKQSIGTDFGFCLGGTYKLGSNISGILATVDDESNISGARLASEWGAGLLLYYSDKLKFEFDYTYSDWRNSGFESVPFFAVARTDLSFKSEPASCIRAGVEYIPNRRDTRYYLKHVSYRAGCYYDQDYMSVGGNHISSKGITLGATFPIVNGFCGLTFALDYGQRGTLNNSLVKENYFNITLGMSLYDIWFRRIQYN